MGMPAEVRRRWTAQEVAELQQEDRAFPRFELVDGDLLVTPSPAPRHQSVVASLFVQIHECLSGSGHASVLMSPADIRLDTETVVQPDIFVYPRGSEPIGDWSEIHSLLLAIEVLSPGTQRQDRTIKREFYQRHGVSEYWIVDIEARRIERWLPGDFQPTTYDTRLDWLPSFEHSALVIDVARLFREAR
jgi:Uma2 family endonuclease